MVRLDSLIIAAPFLRIDIVGEFDSDHRLVSATFDFLPG
jgi:hypothetical protein